AVGCGAAAVRPPEPAARRGRPPLDLHPGGAPRGHRRTDRERSAARHRVPAARRPRAAASGRQRGSCLGALECRCRRPRANVRDPPARSRRAGSDVVRRAPAAEAVTGRRPNRRIRLLAAVFAAVFGVAFLRAGWLQAVRAGTLGHLAATQQKETIALPAHRGTIYDRTGMPLAIGERAVSIYADPRQVADPRAVALAVGRTLGVEPGTLLPLLADRTRGFVYLAR